MTAQRFARLSSCIYAACVLRVIWGRTKKHDGPYGGAKRPPPVRNSATPA